ncbi:MAG: beta-ketoacyl-[acyl-carrier-protein] synthase family protein [Vicingaceae bacterium]
MKKVFVTGMGVISAIGNNTAENLTQLRNGKTGIGKAQHLTSNYAKTHPFAEVKYSTAELKANLNLNNTKGFTRTDYIAFTALKEALEVAQLTSQEISSENTAFISASTIGGMCNTDDLYEDANLISEGSEFVESYPGSTHILKIAKEYQLTGIVDAINTACSSSANAIMLGAKLIKSGRATRAIVGGADAIGKFSVNGFNALQIMSDKACAPFDENRKGLNLGEGAAYLILESEELIGNKKTYAEIVGYGNSNDAFHPSSLSEDAIGVAECMSKALNKAAITPQDIDYINTHGTATGNNDMTELTGINKVFKGFPPFNSTKSYTGHTLAAAGAIEAVYSILSINHNELYPSLNCNTPIQPFNQFPVKNHTKNIQIKTVLSNSFGFGGNCTSLIIRQS